MANSHGGGGWCTVFVGNGWNHRYSGAQHRFLPALTPLKSPCSRRAGFSSSVAPRGGMKNPVETPHFLLGESSSQCPFPTHLASLCARPA